MLLSHCYCILNSANIFIENNIYIVVYKAYITSKLYMLFNMRKIKIL